MAKVRLSIFVIAVFFNVLLIVGANDYCKFTCKNGQHTMCIYPRNAPSDTCSDVISTGLTNQEKERIVQLHNKLRQQVANGLEKRGSPGPQPAAKNMPNLQWDSELEIIAQRWANQCDFDHDCCTVDRFKVGQNIAMERHSAHTCEVEPLVQGWYNEVEQFDARDVSSFKGSKNTRGQFVGHYTQMVWAKTTKIGCGLIKYRKDGWFVTYLVCNYGEAGNCEAQPLYEKK